MSKILILIYGVLSYFIGVIGLVCIIAALAKWIPFGFHAGELGAGSPILWNLLLVAIWGVVHSVMARPGFKKILTRIIPEPAERSTYVLIAGLTSFLLIAYWQNVPGHLWQVDAPWAVMLLWGLFYFGWAFLLAATFAINHFDLFGLRQVYLNFKGRPRGSLKFVKRFMYKFIRHPIQTGVLIGIWATPVMTNTQLILSLGFTLYIAVGLWFEERDLIAEHGDSYRDYRREAGAVLPKISGR